ncbi:CbiX/SirB N-terminal domain-containing protein [Ramlibacter sp. USB13]|uniref:CbiX/SirB N-terminal domain-containing protein n=1 Tax=Ramlibacter cellulosilyticus TaxID=2764187 RepID=A0A923MQD1_9BURK|nr:CbiX/SirB N-terminal domain-containing protein [Ramlibacter cellulosilyticus]MBC5783545.1 CbiX/SirB N-terminal domain-containing protein [Ramlibacter cellulosilyticus]
MARAVVLFGHGSRDPLWRLPMETVATRLRTMRPDTLVRCAFLELDAPSLPAAVADLVTAGAVQVTVVPMFLGTGRHAREDLPALVEQLRGAHPQVEFVLQKPVGEDGRVLDLIAKIALE